MEDCELLMVITLVVNGLKDQILKQEIIFVHRYLKYVNLLLIFLYIILL
jgi:hypothetical protein